MLTNIGGSDLKDGIRRMITSVMTSSYLAGFNWTGKMTHISKDRKQSFQELTLCRIITG